MKNQLSQTAMELIDEIVRRGCTVTFRPATIRPNSTFREVLIEGPSGTGSLETYSPDRKLPIEGALINAWQNYAYPNKELPRGKS
jgi:hypothetical protein